MRTTATRLFRSCDARCSVNYFMRRLALVQRAGAIPVCVFDGAPLPAKRAEEASRASKRAEAIARASEHLRSGNGAAAHEQFFKAVDVTPALAAQVISRLRAAGVEFIVAPFEADATLAHLASLPAPHGVHTVITEDSDLVALGARVFLKLDEHGQGVEIEPSSLPRCKEINLGGFTEDNWLEFCCLSGCDYVESLPGVGVKKAHALIRRHRTAVAAVRTLRFEGVVVPRGYEAAVADAVFVFRHAFVWCPQQRRVVHRTPLPAGTDPARVLALLGDPPPTEEAEGIASGALDPITRAPFAPHEFEGRAPPRAAAPPRGIAAFFSPPGAPPGTGAAAPRAAAAKRSSPGGDAPPCAAAPPASAAKRSRSSAAASLAARVGEILDRSPGGDGAAAAKHFYPPAASDGDTGGSDGATEEEARPSPPRRHPLAWPRTTQENAVGGGACGGARTASRSKFFAQPATNDGRAPPPSSTPANDGGCVEEGGGASDAAPAVPESRPTTFVSPVAALDTRLAAFERRLQSAGVKDTLPPRRSLAGPAQLFSAFVREKR